MKYMVMECHTGYSVLMGEDSSFVKAANLHYKVGQTVEHPLILEEHDKKSSVTVSHSIRKWIMTAAACLLIFAGFGAYIYNSNYSAYSSIIISAEAEVRIELNSKGKVISVEPMNELGEKVLEGYDLEKGQSESDVADTLVKRYVKLGLITSGDTVEFVIDAPDSEIYEDYRSDMKAVADNQSSVSIKAKVRKYDDKNTSPVSTGKREVPAAVTSEKKQTEAVKPSPEPKKEQAPAAAPPREEREIAPPVIDEAPKPSIHENAPVPSTPEQDEKPKPDTVPKVKPELPDKEKEAAPSPDKVPELPKTAEPPEPLKPAEVPDERQHEKPIQEERHVIDEQRSEEQHGILPEHEAHEPINDPANEILLPENEKPIPIHSEDNDEKLPEHIADEDK